MKNVRKFEWNLLKNVIKRSVELKELNKDSKIYTVFTEFIDMKFRAFNMNYVQTIKKPIN